MGWPLERSPRNSSRPGGRSGTARHGLPRASMDFCAIADRKVDGTCGRSPDGHPREAADSVPARRRWTRACSFRTSRRAAGRARIADAAPSAAGGPPPQYRGRSDREGDVSSARLWSDIGSADLACGNENCASLREPQPCEGRPHAEARHQRRSPTRSGTVARSSCRQTHDIPRSGSDRADDRAHLRPTAGCQQQRSSTVRKRQEDRCRRQGSVV
jgi:hypothetical protein